MNIFYVINMFIQIFIYIDIIIITSIIILYRSEKFVLYYIYSVIIYIIINKNS